MKLVDGVIPEPNGGGHRDKNSAIASLKNELEKHFGALCTQNFKDPHSKTSLKIKEDRYQKFRHMTDFGTEARTVGAHK
jgi:acetyl-CoA carboxylase alpha subunit